MPWWELVELVYGGLGLLDEPVDGLAGTVVPQAVLNVVELNGRVGREPHAPVSWALGRADLAVPVLSASRPYNVTALNLHNLAAPGAGHSPYPQSRRCWGGLSLVMMVALPHFSRIFDSLLAGV